MGAKRGRSSYLHAECEGHAPVVGVLLAPATGTIIFPDPGVGRAPLWQNFMLRERRGRREQRACSASAQYVTTNDVLKPPALPQLTRIGQRPGVVLVPTFHVHETRPSLGRFG